MARLASQKRSVTVKGHRTSVTLEQVFWESLKEIADARNQSINAIIAEIDGAAPNNLSSAIRIFVLENYKRKAALLDK